MYNDKKVTAIITAAGKGSRMGSSIPKQFFKIGGITVLEKTISPFEEIDEVDDILVVSREEFISKCDVLCKPFRKVRGIIAGGSERQDSVRNALNAVECDDGLVLIHDGARPYVTKEIIIDVLKHTLESGAAVAAVPAKDTIRQVNLGESITLDSSSLYNVQTPQGFKTELIKRAFEKAYTDNYYGTDDAVLVERLGKEVSIARGSYSNIKITTREDLPLNVRVGMGYDVHKLTEERKLILCGVNIPFEKGLLGHSDADVAVHALMDAMLGAAAMGDIGRHFPDTDERYKGISSMILLKKVKELIDQKGYTVGNVDITIMAQKPKLAPYIEEMRKNVAGVLKLEIGDVNVKATTTEKLGFVGREEGIAAEAVCIINRC